MKKFNVIWWDFNKPTPEPYNVLPALMDEYFRKPRSQRPKLTDRTAMIAFVKSYALYRWWSRCEYEIVIYKWPTGDKSEKKDIYDQLLMNIGIIVDLLVENIREQNRQNRLNRSQTKTTED